MGISFVSTVPAFRRHVTVFSDALLLLLSLFCVQDLFVPVVICYCLTRGPGIKCGKKSPWLLVRKRTISSDRRLSAKLVPTFADRGCRVVSATDPYDKVWQRMSNLKESLIIMT
jgi:hypothetical protein